MPSTSGTVSGPTFEAGDDPDAIASAAFRSIGSGQDEAALASLRSALHRHPNTPRLWHAFGLAARNLSDLKTAIEAFSKAHALSPADALIAHGLARTRLEGGVSSVDDFRRAHQLAPSDLSVIQGAAAAMLADNHESAAVSLLEKTLSINPLWIDGHRALARLNRILNRSEVFRGFEGASRRLPEVRELWLAWLGLLIGSENYAEAYRVSSSALRYHPNDSGIALYKGIAAEEIGQYAEARTFFDSQHAISFEDATLWRVRSYLRQGRVEEAASSALAQAIGNPSSPLWPYLILAWRLLNDPRAEWLADPSTLVQTFDLAAELPDISSLGRTLQGLHKSRDEPLDQSVRGGTQTEGPLFSRLEPDIGHVRMAVTRAVRDYIDGLPPRDPSHPLLSVDNSSIRFAGSWSVSLRNGGFHSDHVHPQGWISSALYLRVPDSGLEDRGSGWLSLGACRPVVPDLAPLFEIEPKPGRLVLFPSYMWHGTRPFARGERLSIAFDIARPIK